MAERRVYLRRRLASGEITLEEARELFGAMEEDLVALRDTAGGSRPSDAPPPPPPPPPPGYPVSPPNGMATAGAEEFFLLMGPVAGIFAAILKRSMEGERPRPGTAAKAGAK